MKKLLKLFAVAVIILSGVGGLLTGIYPLLGTSLVIIGIASSVYTHISSERRNNYLEQVMEAQNRLLSRSGVGSPYTEMVMAEFKSKGSCPQSINLLKKALQANPDDLKALNLYTGIMTLNFSMRQWVKGVSYGPENKEWQNVFELTERARDKHPDNFSLLATMGMLLDIAGKHEDARRMFRESGKMRTDPLWHIHVATSYGMSGRPDLALKEIQTAVKEGAHGWIAEYPLAEINFSLGNYDEAIMHSRKAIALGGKIPQLHSIEARSLFACGRLVASAVSKVRLAWVLRLLNTKRSFLLIFAALGHLFIMILVIFSKKIWPITSRIPLLNKFQYKHLPPIEPESTIVSTLVQRRHFKKAIELLEKCKTISPRDVGVLRKLAFCYAHYGRMDEAVKTIDEALQLLPDDQILLHDREQYISRNLSE
jgi:tetratricopeptide (TPR) repeat protein